MDIHYTQYTTDGKREQWYCPACGFRLQVDLAAHVLELLEQGDAGARHISGGILLPENIERQLDELLR